MDKASKSDVVELKMSGLEHFMKALKEGTHERVCVGVLGDKASRSGDTGETNASIGAKHEYGLDGMPVRSFLRMPMMLKLNDSLKNMGAMDANTLKEIINKSKITLFLKNIGIVAENVIQDAFHTGGFGQWKPSNMQFKTNHQTLVETQQLRNSITSEVRDNG